MQTAICCMHGMCLLSPSVSPGTIKWFIPHSPTTRVSKPHLLRDFLLLEALEDKDFPGRQTVNFIREKKDAKTTAVYDTIKRRPKGQESYQLHSLGQVFLLSGPQFQA